MSNHRPNYMPVRENDFIKWFQEFLATLTVVAPQVGITEQQLQALRSLYDMLIECEKRVTHLTTLLHSYIAAKNTLLNGREGETVVFETIAAINGSMVEGGIKDAVVRTVALIKASPNYTEAIGRDLGIEAGPRPAPEWAGKYPTLTGTILGGTRVQITWVKGRADGVYLEVNRGEGWQIVGTLITGAVWDDPTPLPPSVTEWRYRATYVSRNQTVGNLGPDLILSVHAKPQ
ncbi:hypothetical protein OpiT1DRAFT_01475 [Opitutaceae bacterium TAV1]|nr:hypothetical protein OpiT1DRAFT_01475 [Opitutaceae bacterium TAV1]